MGSDDSHLWLQDSRARWDTTRIRTHRLDNRGGPLDLEDGSHSLLEDSGGGSLDDYSRLLLQDSDSL